MSKLVYKDVQENLKKELEELRTFLNYKNAKFCKKKLESVLHRYFGKKITKKEVIVKKR